MKKKQVFNGRLLNLFLTRQRYPNGYVANLEVVEHPGAVLIVPFLRDNRIVLIRQYRPVVNRTIWELPAGTLHKGERPLRCAKRELVEETGYRASQWMRLGYIYPAPGYTTEKIVLYAARRMSKVPSELQEDEVITAHAVSKRGVTKLVRSGKIVDAKTICALTLAGALSI